MSRLTRRVAIRTRPVASSYDPAAVAYFAAMTVQPSTARKELLNALIVGLKADGVWDTYDLLYIGASHDQQAARLNVVNPTGPFNLQAVNSPVFVVDRYIGSQSGGGYWNTGFNLTITPEANRKLKSSSQAVASAAFGLFSLLNFQNVSSCVGAYQDGAVGGYTLAPLSDGSNAGVRVQSVNGAMVNVFGNSLGLFNARRFQSNVINVKKNKNAPETAAFDLGPVPNQTFRFGNISGANGQPMQAAFGFVGGYKTDAQCDAEYDRFRTYLTAIGVP